MSHLSIITRTLLPISFFTSQWILPLDIDARSVRIYAAASLTDVLQDLSPKFEAQAGFELKFAFGGSSTLAKQIENGAPADIYFSASPEWMDYLETQSRIEEGTRFDLLGNCLVIVAPVGEEFRVVPLKGFDFPASFRGMLAIGDPSHVPAGIYAEQALRWFGWWGPLSKRIAPGLDVRAALAYVERGECSAGLIYATDAAISSKVSVIATLPTESHDRIVYPVAVVKDRHTESVRLLMEWLQSDEAGKVFEEQGFEFFKKDTEVILQN